MSKIKVSVTISETKEKVFEVIKAMDRFPEFMEDVKSVNIVYRSRDKLITEWKTDIDGTPIEWTEEDIFDNKELICKFRTLKGNYKYNGTWKVEEIGLGQTRITINTEFDWEVPNFEKFLGHILTKKARISLRSMLNAIKKKVSVSEKKIITQKSQSVDKFAFIFHPYDMESLADKGLQEPALRMKARRLVERSLRWMPPFKRESVEIKSTTGKVIKGEMIMVSLICEQILNMDSDFVLKKTIEAGELAQKLGARIIGLGAYLAAVGRKGVQISSALNIPVTTGISNTIAVALNASLKAACEVGIDLDEAKVTVVGATGSIGRVCSTILANRVDSITLVARNRNKLELFANDLSRKSPQCNISYTSDIKNAVADSDMVMISTNTPTALLKADDLPQGCIVCDISVPHNISYEDAEKSNILIIDGGLVKCPSTVDFNYMALPQNEAYACLAETMILTMEGLFQDYSIGGKISIDRVENISRLSNKHGFKLAEFRSFGKPVSKEQIERVKKARVAEGKKLCKLPPASN